MKHFLSQGIITNLYTAFSRNEKKQYVQDLMKGVDASQRLINLVTKENGVIYICGDGNSMARDVQNTLAEILSVDVDGNHDANVGREHIEKLKREGRLLLDIWS
jgi:sulfite reductase alpha subunit-like flavoprotein